MSESINLNQAECFKLTAGLGEKVYHNICDGTQYVIPWGAGDWFLATILVGVAIAIFTVIPMILYVPYKVIKGDF